MDLSIVANNRWVVGDLRSAVQEWMRRGALPIRIEFGQQVRPADLAFIWDGHTRQLVAFAQFQIREAGGARPARVRSTRQYRGAAALIYPVNSQNASLPWQPQWRANPRAFVELDAGIAEQLLDGVRSEPLRGAQPGDAVAVARIERTVRDEVLLTLNGDEGLRRAWREWRRAGHQVEGADVGGAKRVVRLPERPEEAALPELATFYLDEVLATLAALELAAEGATKIDGSLVIAARPGEDDELDVSKLLSAGRNGLFDQARMLRSVFKAYLDRDGSEGRE